MQSGMQVKVKSSPGKDGKRRRVSITIHGHTAKDSEQLDRYISPHRRTGRFVAENIFNSWGGKLPDDAEAHMQWGTVLYDAPLLLVALPNAMWKIQLLLDESPIANALLHRLEQAHSIEAVTIGLEQLQLEAEHQALLG